MLVMPYSSLMQEAKEGLNKSMYARYSADPEQRKREAMQDPEVQVYIRYLLIHPYLATIDSVYDLLKLRYYNETSIRVSTVRSGYLF